MYRQQFYIVANFLMVIDAIALISTAYLAYSISLKVGAGGLVMPWYEFLGSILFLVLANNYFMGKGGFYSARRFAFPSTWSMIGALFLVVLLDFIVFSTGVIVIGHRPFSRVYLLAHFPLAFIALIVPRLIVYYYLDHRAPTTFNSCQILLVGSHYRVAAVANALDRQRSWGHQVTGRLTLDDKENSSVTSDIPVLGTMDDFDKTLRERQIDEVIFALPRGLNINLERYIESCEKTGVTVRIVPSLYTLGKPNFRVGRIQQIPTLTHYASFASASGLLYKKVLDLVVGLFGFLIFLLLYPIVGLAIKLDSPGPVLFKQARIGMRGRVFTLYKFRSMTSDAESRKPELLAKSQMNGPMFKMDDDPRITRVGRFLRKTSLDEFPQFINVLKGEMSLVGTRPPTTDEVKEYKDWHRRRISIKPGITGLWQISGRNKITEFSDVVDLDLAYIDRWRFWKDLAILYKTIWVVLARKGAK